MIVVASKLRFEISRGFLVLRKILHRDCAQHVISLAFLPRAQRELAPEKTVPQGKDAPGNEDQSKPTTEHKGVIKPPQTGDQGIYTQVPNPNAGTKEEVIPPSGSPGSEHPNVEPR